MHENANIRNQMQESTFIMSTVISLQPRSSGEVAGVPSEQVVMLKAQEIEEQLPQPLLMEEVHAHSFSPPPL